MIEVEVVRANDQHYGRRGILEEYALDGSAMVRLSGLRELIRLNPDDLARVID
jgi:hypothetical protein